jgi:hypothetical protein
MFINYFLLLLPINAHAEATKADLQGLELRCLAQIDTKKLEERFKEYQLDKLSEELQRQAAHDLVGANLLECMEKEVSK